MKLPIINDLRGTPGHPKRPNLAPEGGDSERGLAGGTRHMAGTAAGAFVERKAEAAGTIYLFAYDVSVCVCVKGTRGNGKTERIRL